MNIVAGALSGLAGLALMYFAGSRTVPRERLPWQIAACLVYTGVAVGGLVGSATMPAWTASLLIGGGLGILLSVLVAGRKAGQD